MFIATVDVDDIVLGVSEADRGWWNWQVYLDTWSIVDDAPETPVEELPLYRAMKRHYARIDDGWLKRDLKILGLREGDRESVARGWTRRHVQLYLKIRAEGFDPSRSKMLTGWLRRDGKVRLRDGHHRVSMLKHLGMPRKVKVKLLGRR